MYCVYLWQVTIGSVTVPSVVTTFSWLHLGVAVTPVTKNANAEFDWSRVHQNSHNYSIITYPLLISSTVTQTQSFILYWLYSFYQSTVVLCYLVIQFVQHVHWGINIFITMFIAPVNSGGWTTTYGITLIKFSLDPHVHMHQKVWSIKQCFAGLVSGGPCLVRANSYVYTVRYNFIRVNLSPWK